MRLLPKIFVAVSLLLSFPSAHGFQAATAAENGTIAPSSAPSGTVAEILEAEAPPEAPANIASESAILIDQQSGRVLFAKNERARLYPASITKIVTAIVALETSRLDETVTVSREARYEDGTRVYLSEGEQKSMELMLYAMMLNSGNDAATAIAEHIDGSKAEFAERMNDFATNTVGVSDTFFVNPSGLPDPNQVTTAADMARIARYAMQNETFREIVSTVQMPWDGLEWKSELYNHNRLLTTYEGATGIKNGYTTAAGNTLVSSATRGDEQLIGVVLKAPSNKNAYADMTALFDYGFAAFESAPLLAAGETHTEEIGDETYEWRAEEEIRALMPIGALPSFRVDAQGSVLLDTEFGEQAVGTLTPVKKQVHALQNTEAAAAAMPVEEEKLRNGWIWAGAAGAVIAAAALWMAGKRRKKRRKSVHFP